MGIITVNKDFEKLWGMTQREFYSRQYLTFEALEDGSFGINWSFEFLTDASDDLMKHISYSVDNGETWTTQEINDDEGLSVEGIKAGQTILLKGDGLTANSGNDEPINFNFMTGGSNAKFNVYGNIMSLIYGDNFEGKEFDDNFDDTMGWLFKNSYVVSAKNLILPDNVFTYCYQELFANCTELTEAPVLPATTLANGCYVSMFNGCTSLTTAPVLPATTLVSACYAYMFNGCTNLNHIKALFTTTPSNDYTRNWVNGVAATGTLIINKDYDGTRSALNVPATWTILNEDGTPHIFPRDYSEEYLTIEASKGELNVDITIPYNGVLDSDAIQYLGYSLDSGETWTKIIDINTDDIQNNIQINCNLNTGDTILFKGTADYYGYYDDTEDEKLFSNFHFLGGQNIKIYGNIMSLFYGDNFVGKTSFTNGSSYNCAGLFMHNDECGNIDCSDLVLPATTLTDYCYSEMFNECWPLTAVPVLPATTLAASCYYYMFKNCSLLTTAPVLPATELKQSCYGSMFASCSKLNYIKAMFTTTPSNTYTSNWVNGVAATGTFVKNKNATWTTTGNNGVPTGWTVETA